MADGNGSNADKADNASLDAMDRGSSGGSDVISGGSGDETIGDPNRGQPSGSGPGDISFNDVLTRGDWGPNISGMNNAGQAVGSIMAASTGPVASLKAGATPFHDLKLGVGLGLVRSTLDVGLLTVNVAYSDKPLKTAIEGVFGIAGGILGAAVGGFAGSALGPVGGFIGGGVGYNIGLGAGNMAGQAVTDFFGLPIVLDLDGDGLDLVALDKSKAMYDIDGDGYLENVGWVGDGDGFLSIDLNGDGLILEPVELAFALSTDDPDDTDLEGLAATYDSNHDGVLDANDAEFAKFRVWRDIDQDGVCDAGEVKSLAEHGITSINLTSGKKEEVIAGNKGVRQHDLHQNRWHHGQGG